jgi:DNA-binding response OmpR family regulator
MGTQFSEQHKRILCVDDDLDTVDLLKYFLSNYRIFSASRVADALRMIKAQAFDLYVLDNWLPDGTGVTLCRHIRESDPNTPIIFLSAVAQNEHKQEAFSAGAQEYLVKPISLDEIGRAIVSLDKASQLRSLEARAVLLAVIQEELSLRREQLRTVRAEASGREAKAMERLIKMKAKLAFIAAGGTRASFERTWPELIKKEDATSRPDNSALSQFQHADH